MDVYNSSCKCPFVHYCSKHWLSHVGSSRSRIEKCEFTDEREITETNYTDFTIVKR